MGANYIGDVGGTYFVSPENPAFGILYKWNRTTRYSLRANAMVMNVKKVIILLLILPALIENTDLKIKSWSFRLESKLILRF